MIGTGTRGYNGGPARTGRERIRMIPTLTSCSAACARGGTSISSMGGIRLGGRSTSRERLHELDGGSERRSRRYRWRRNQPHSCRRIQETGECLASWNVEHFGRSSSRKSARDPRHAIEFLNRHDAQLQLLCDRRSRNPGDPGWRPLRGTPDL